MRRSEIPADIQAEAKRVARFVRAFEGHGDERPIARALLAERRRCIAVIQKAAIDLDGCSINYSADIIAAELLDPPHPLP